MTIQDFAAFIGAAAWLYPISVFIKKIFTKPKIKLVPIDTIELGYATSGPIINMQCAIMTEKEDAIIERIEFELTHEDSAVHNLIWKTLDEIQFEVRSFTGEGGTIGRTQSAIVLKVSTTMLSEKKIGFQDPKFHEQSQNYTSKLVEQFSHLRKTEIPDPFNVLFQTKEFTDLNTYFKNGMYWRVGKYNLKISIFIIASNKPFTEFYSFSLDNNNIESLKMNTEFLELSIRNLIAPFMEEKQAYPQVIWSWVYPKLKQEK